MPQGTPPSEEALRKLAAQLGAPQGQGFPGLSPEQLDYLQMLAKNPELRRYLEQHIKDNPQVIDQLKKSDPMLAETIKQQLPKENNPFEPKLPPPGGPKGPPNTKGWPPPPPPPNFPKKPNPAEDSREFQEMAKLWEQAVGPLDDTPAVRQALIDMFSGTGSTKPGEKPFWADWDPKDGNSNSGSSFAKWLKGLNGNNGGNSNLKMPKWFGGKASNFTAPSMKMPTALKMPSLGFNSFDIGVPSIAGLGSAGTALLILAAVALLAFLIWKFAPQLGLSKSRSPKPLPGLGPWPIDPRNITDREGLIKAFEYISVLLCGDGARVWNHATIAEALRDSVPTAAAFADPLARLYALARYTPLSDRLSAEAIAEGRGYLCQLAGVPAS